MIQLSFQQGFGSSAMAYCFARHSATRWGYAFRSLGLPGFTESRAELKGRELLGPRVRWDGQWPREAQSGRSVVAGELEIGPEAWLTLSGEFQRFELIADVRDEVREDWLKLDGGAQDAGLLICVREGDVDLLGKVRGKEDGTADIRRLAKLAKRGKLHFLTDLKTDPLREKLRDLGGTWHVETGVEAIRLAKGFSRIAFCQSALYWWGAFLGDAREIYFPKIATGLWSHPEPAKFAYDPPHHGIDLRVTDEKRWVYDW